MRYQHSLNWSISRNDRRHLATLPLDHRRHRPVTRCPRPALAAPPAAARLHGAVGPRCGADAEGRAVPGTAAEGTGGAAVTLEVGMLWWDGDKHRPLAEKVQRAAAFYQAKYGAAPTVCHVNPKMVTDTQQSALSAGSATV